MCSRSAYIIIDSLEILSDYLFVWQWEQHQTCVFLRILLPFTHFSIYYARIRATAVATTTAAAVAAAIFRLMNLCAAEWAALCCLYIVNSYGNRIASATASISHFDYYYFLWLFWLFCAFLWIIQCACVSFFFLCKLAYMHSHVQTPYSAKMGIRYEQKQFMSKNNVCRFTRKKILCRLSIPVCVCVLCMVAMHSNFSSDASFDARPRSFLCLSLIFW